MNVTAIVTIERRLHPDGITAAAKQLSQNLTAKILFTLPSCVEVLAKVSGMFSGPDEFGVERIIQFTSEHLLFLGCHRAAFTLTSPDHAEL